MNVPFLRLTLATLVHHGRSFSGGGSLSDGLPLGGVLPLALRVHRLGLVRELLVLHREYRRSLDLRLLKACNDAKRNVRVDLPRSERVLAVQA